MGRYAVYRNPDASTRARTPYLLDIQSDAVSVLPTRLVVPVRKVPDASRISRVHIEIEIDGAPHTALVNEMAAVLQSRLGTPATSVEIDRAAITAAVDLLFTGL